MPPYATLPPQLQALAQAFPGYATALGLGPMLGSPMTAGAQMQPQQNQMAQQPAAVMAAAQNMGVPGMPPGQQQQPPPSPLIQALMAQGSNWGS